MAPKLCESCNYQGEHPNKPHRSSVTYILRAALSVVCLVIGIWWLTISNYSAYDGRFSGIYPLRQTPSRLRDHCSHIHPMQEAVYLERQKMLAESLIHLNASAYIAEPGANALFYTNVSTSNWRLSERPLLIIVTPRVTPEGSIQAAISVLTPKFEAARAKLLSIPAANPVHFVEWAEESDPYQTAASILSGSNSAVYVDSSIRHFIVEGFQRALPHSKLTSAPTQITHLRERKSATEIRILQCANEATLLAIRDIHSRMYVGMKESDARKMMAFALSEVGLKDGGCLTLFGENAAFPHGSGTDRILGSSDFALFDCTASLHGYWSDVTRTVALPDSQIREEHLKIWNLVHDAQTIAIRSVHNGALTRNVDEAARQYLDAKGYAQYFTHRLGHGIGLEVHEQPYLNGGSNDLIQPGHTFSDEPGVYIENKLGVRLEDCFYLDQSGIAVFLTLGVGGQSISPWRP